MTRRKAFALIPLVPLVCLLIYSWIRFAFYEEIPHWQHYVALVLFMPLAFIAIRFSSHTWLTPLAGVYLMLGVLNWLSFTWYLKSFGFSILGFPIPMINGLSLVLLIVYVGLNFDSLVDVYHDYLEKKGKL